MKTSSKITVPDRHFQKKDVRKNLSFYLKRFLYPQAKKASVKSNGSKSSVIASLYYRSEISNFPHPGG